MSQFTSLTSDVQDEIVRFAQDLVRIRSLTGHEEEIVRFVASAMTRLGYDEVTIDGMGNVLGRIGTGGKSIFLDSHVDTVDVTDADKWSFPPFSGEVIDGRLCGRGSVDMKGAIAASIYAGVLAMRSGLAEGKTIYVSCSVMEEDCDGESLKHLFGELNLRPDCVVICEPSGNRIAVGHKGKLQATITTQGVSAHGSAPEKGVNAIYEMAEIIQRVERLNAELMQRGDSRGTLVMSRISSVSASLNAVPSECQVYLDRRIAPAETEVEVRAELDQLIREKNARWQVGTVRSRSWTGRDVTYEPFHLGWRIDDDHELARASVAAYEAYFGSEPPPFVFWNFSTNAVTPVSMGIPTIGFGPGDSKLAHMVDECCPVSQIVDACGFYLSLIEKV